MGNPAVEAAIKGLSLIGIDIPPSAEGFIELLINAGEDVLTEVPRIISIIEQLGGEAWSTLEQVVNGIEQHGVVGYVQQLIDHHFQPHVETITNIQNQKKIMLDTHRTTLTNFQNQIQPLFTGPQAFQGPAATQAQTSFTSLTSGMSGHLDLLEQSHAIDQKFFSDYQSAVNAAADATILALIVGAILLVLYAVLVGFTGGAAAAGGFLIPLGVTVAEAWILGGVIAVFATWEISYNVLKTDPNVESPSQLIQDIEDWLKQQRPDPNTDPNQGTDPAPWPWTDPVPPGWKDLSPQDRDDCEKKIALVKAQFPDVRADLIHYLVCLKPPMTPQQVIDLFTYWTTHGMSQQDINNMLDKLMNLQLDNRFAQPSRLQIITFLQAHSTDIPDIWQKYKQIKNKPGADFILHDMIIGPDTKYRGSYFQLKWVVSNQNDVQRIEYFGADGKQGADALLFNGSLVDTKNYIWKDQAFLLKLGKPQTEIRNQLTRYMTDPNFSGRPVNYVFNSDGGRIPASVQAVFNEFKKRGLKVTVTYWPKPDPPQIVP